MVPYTYSFCRRCDGRVELGRVAYGAKVACPACGLEFVIESPTQSGGEAGQGRGGDGEHAARSGRSAGAAGGRRHRLSARAVLRRYVQLSLPARSSIANADPVLSSPPRYSPHSGSARGAPPPTTQKWTSATRVLLWNGLALSITCGALALMALDLCGVGLRHDDPPRYGVRRRRHRAMAELSRVGGRRPVLLCAQQRYS